VFFGKKVKNFSVFWGVKQKSDFRKATNINRFEFSKLLIIITGVANMEFINIIIAVLFLLVILYIVAQVLMKPIKLLWKLLINSFIGLVLLVVVNYIAAFFAFNIPINIITVLIAGFLGVPGIVLLICFQLLII